MFAVIAFQCRGCNGNTINFRMHLDNVLVVTILSSLFPVLGLHTNPVSIPKGQKHGNIVIAAVISTPLLPDSDSFGVCELEGFDLNPSGPLVPCSFLDDRLAFVFD